MLDIPHSSALLTRHRKPPSPFGMDQSQDVAPVHDPHNGICLPCLAPFFQPLTTTKSVTTLCFWSRSGYPTYTCFSPPKMQLRILLIHAEDVILPSAPSLQPQLQQRARSRTIVTLMFWSRSRHGHPARSSPGSPGVGKVSFPAQAVRGDGSKADVEQTGSPKEWEKDGSLQSGLKELHAPM